MNYLPLQWASSWELELTVTLHVGQWRCFLLLLDSLTSSTFTVSSSPPVELPWGSDCGAELVAELHPSTCGTFEGRSEDWDPGETWGDRWGEASNEQSVDEVCEEGVAASELPLLISICCCAEVDDVTGPVNTSSRAKAYFYSTF